MAKRALLIGVNEYKVGLAGLSSPIKNVEALREILEDQNGYRVSCLPNPSVQEMRREIELFFLNNNLERDDLGLLFFSGHGLKDDHGDLYFAATDTEKVVGGELRQATAVYAIDIQRWLRNSKCRRKVIILDCCFSGAFPRRMRVFGDNKIDFAGQLLGSLREEEYGGKGIVILTSSSAIENSYEREGLELSIYTHYLVEGLETGSADIDQDRRILAKELHDYVSDKVSQEESLMTPQIFRVNEGGEIVIAEVKPIEIEPAEQYRKLIEDYFIKFGKIPDERRKLVDATANSLGLSPEEAAKIEDSVREPYQEHEKNSNIYRENFYALLRSDKCYPLPAEDLRSLKGLQQLLRLSDKDIEGINRSEILRFYDEKLNQIVNDPKTPKEVQRKADELMLSLSLAKQDVENINKNVISSVLRPDTNIFTSLFKLFKNPPFYVSVVIFLGIAITYRMMQSQNNTSVVPPIPKITKITDIKAPEGSFSYTSSSTWAPVVCSGKGIDNYITSYTNKGKFILSGVIPNIHKSSTAFVNLIDKDKDKKDKYAFAIISSEITPKMREKAKENDIELDSMTVAQDAIAFGANVNLKITDGLSKNNLKQIYVDAAKQWSDVLRDTSTLPIRTVFRDFGNETHIV